MLKGTLDLGVVSHGLAAAVQLVFVSKQTFQTHGAASVQLAVADAQLCAQAVAEAIGKARGGVVKNAGGVDFIHEKLRGAAVPRKNAFGVTRAVVVDMFNRLRRITYDLDGDLEIAVFGVPVFLSGGDDLAARKQFGRLRAAANFHAGRLQR